MHMHVFDIPSNYIVSVGSSHEGFFNKKLIAQRLFD